MRTIRSAFVLLNSDENTLSLFKKDTEIAEMLGISVKSVENIRKKFVLEGYKVALYGRPSSHSINE